MNSVSKLAAVALMCLGGLVVTASTASAAIVCNANGVCWHVRHPYAYGPSWGLVVHPDGWRWGPGDHYVWHEHAGRGYWRGGVWVRF